MQEDNKLYWIIDITNTFFFFNFNFIFGRRAGSLDPVTWI